MRAVKLITWNPQDEVYEMILGTLTATHISSYDISCTEDLHVGGNLWVGDEFLTAALIRSLKEPAEDLNLNTLKAHQVDILDNDDEKGRLAVSDVYLTDLYGTSATLGSADIDSITCTKITVGGDMTVDANIIPETTSSWLGDDEHPWGNVCTQKITCSSIVADSGLEIEGSIYPLSDDGSNFGSKVRRWHSIYTYSLDCKSNVTTPHINFGTGSIGSSDEGLLSMKGSLVPKGNATYDLGASSYKWRYIYTENLVCTSSVTSSVTLMSSNNTHQITMNINSGDLTIAGFHNECGLVLTYGDSYQKPPISCGKIYGELVSPEYVPTDDNPEFPSKDEYTAPPFFAVAIGSIIMAIPCWATLRSLSPLSAGQIIDVVVPNNWQTAQPFEHTTGFENDPERGAWYYATFEPGDGTHQSAYVPLHTLTQGSDSVHSNYAYLAAGKYKLLNCVSAYSGSYSEYSSNGLGPTGACVMLQRIQ